MINVSKTAKMAEITAILNKYKNILDDFIDSLDTESLDQLESLNWPGLIDKERHNTPKARNASPSLLEEEHLDEDILVMMLEQVHKT